MIEILKEEVVKKFGKKITYQKDCNTLATSIFNDTKQYISPATLRRVFGFLQTNSNPSRVTLDILSQFVGYGNWENFNKNHRTADSNLNYNISDLWKNVAENAKNICGNTIEHIRLKSGIDFDNTISRQFAFDRFRYFTNSKIPATAIIAPGGYGKSTLLAQWCLSQQNKRSKSNDVILFLPAHMLDQFAPTELFVDIWLLRILNINPENNFFDDLLNERITTPGKFILVIDALDEITSQGAKQEKIFRTLVDLAEKFATTTNFKLILATRLSTWKLFSSYIRNQNNWYFTNAELISHDGANIPPLTVAEIQNILDNTLNKRFSNRIFVHELPQDLREIIAYPYFLQLFIQVCTPETLNTLNNQLSILNEFLKKQVYFSQYSDEKMDILNQIIQLSNYGSRYVLKDELKNFYPIHLKLSGNYYGAYEELISFGIVIEETQVDNFGGYSKYIKIANPQLTSMLVVQGLIKREQGITKNLFKWINENLKEYELLSTIVGMLFKFAYRDRIIEPLKDFFNLDANTLELVMSTPAIPTAIRSDNYMRNQLIPIYSQQAVARKFLIEDNIDINHLVDSYTFILKHYLQNSKIDSEKSFANSLLAFSGFISLDIPLAIKHYNSIKIVVPKHNTPPLLAGIWYSCMIIFEIFMGSGKSDKCIEDASKFYSALPNIPSKADFSEVLIPILIITKQFDKYSNFIYNTDDFCKFDHRTAMNFLFTKYYQLTIENRQITSDDSSTIEKIYSNLNPLRSYIGIILGENLRASYFLQNNNLEYTNNCLRNAIELSSIAGYKLVEASLLKNLSNTLYKFGEDKKAVECLGYVDSLWKLSGFQTELP